MPEPRHFFFELVMMNKFYKFSVIIAITQLIILGIVFIHVNSRPTLLRALWQHQQKDNLDFSIAKSCQSGVGVREGISSSSWSENTLTVKANVNLNCGVFLTLGDYSIEGNLVKIKYKAISDQSFLCTCLVELTYKIRNAERKEFLYLIDNDDSLLLEPAWYHWFWKQQGTLFNLNVE